MLIRLEDDMLAQTLIKKPVSLRIPATQKKNKKPHKIHCHFVVFRRLNAWFTVDSAQLLFTPTQVHIQR